MNAVDPVFVGESQGLLQQHEHHAATASSDKVAIFSETIVRLNAESVYAIYTLRVRSVFVMCSCKYAPFTLRIDSVDTMYSCVYVAYTCIRSVYFMYSCVYAARIRIV